MVECEKCGIELSGMKAKVDYRWNCDSCLIKKIPVVGRVEWFLDVSDPNPKSFSVSQCFPEFKLTHCKTHNHLLSNHA